MDDVLKKRVSEVFKNFDSEDLNKLSEVLTYNSIEEVIEFEETEEEWFDNEKGEENTRALAVRFRLYARITRECYYFYSRYKYEAWVKRTDTGKAYKVDSIKMTMDSGNGAFSVKVKNSSKVTKVDKVTGALNTCKSARLNVVAIKGDRRAEVEVRLP